MSDPKKVKMGKRKKAEGAAFERRVRDDLEEKGWIVDKWTNNVELTMMDKGIDVEKETQDNHDVKMIIKEYQELFGKLVRAKAKWAGPNRPMMMGAGFPDFVALRRNPEYPNINVNYEVIGVESKMTGELDKAEKEKCVWLLDNKIFSKILIAEKTKVKNRVFIVYHDFKEKYYRFLK